METYLSRKQLAERWNRSPYTLANWVPLGIGPQPVRRDDGSVRYRLSDVLAYEAEHDMSRD